MRDNTFTFRHALVKKAILLHKRAFAIYILATTVVTLVDWAKLIFCDERMDGQTDLPVEIVI